MKYIGASGAYLEIIRIGKDNADVLRTATSSQLSLLWFHSDGNHLEVDLERRVFDTNDIVCLTEFNKVEAPDIKAACLMSWNKPFYCLVNHDSEVGCRGVLFYGASSLPIIRPAGDDAELFAAGWEMLGMEMRLNDSLQEEMLQMMLKRILILCTRMYREQSNDKGLGHANINILKEYHFLVERHFKEKHTVAEYAEMLHKSPKTLSNLFKKLGSKTPLQFIKDRKALEARRLLGYTDKSISQIGYELGFADVQSFSRFFKKEQGVTPLRYKKKLKGKTGNS